MKIIQLVTERQYRGAQVFAAELTALLAQRQHQVYFVGLYPVKENILQAQGADNIDLDGKKKALDVSLLKSLLKLFRKVEPDIVQANGSDTLKYAAIAKIFYPRLKIVYRNISMVSSWTGAGSMKRKLNRLLFKQVDRVTSVGQQSMEDLVKTYHYPANNTKLIRRGIPQLEFDKEKSRKKLASEFRFPATDFILIHIGQFSTEKNHPFLIESFEHVLTRDQNCRLIFIGQGKDLEKSRALVAGKKLGNHILFAGYRSNVQEILAGADLFILGSTIEGVPGVVLEAGMQSIPAVAVNVGGVGEVVINDQTGVLLPNHDAEAFARAILALKNNDAGRQRLGATAKQFVVDHYSLKRSAEEFEQLYQDILAKKNISWKKK